MSSQQEILTKGDWIVHAHYGVGQIKGKDKKSFDGEKKTFFRVRTFNGVYWLSTSNTETDHIRPIASKNQIKRALRLIRRAPKKLPKDYKKRGKEISGVLRDVSLYPKVRMIRDLYARKRAKKLNFSEGDALEKMKKSFIDEWSLVDGLEPDVLEGRLRQALRTSLEKRKDRNGKE
jgi:RNA polymerase-interacting CarD/CdnL/TRCF family regulator